MASAEWTLRLHEIEGHGFAFEASDGDGKYLGTFERIEVYRFKAFDEAADENGEVPEDFPPGVVIEAGDEYRARCDNSLCSNPGGEHDFCPVDA